MLGTAATAAAAARWAARGGVMALAAAPWAARRVPAMAARALAVGATPAAATPATAKKGGATPAPAPSTGTSTSTVGEVLPDGSILYRHRPVRTHGVHTDARGELRARG